MTVKKKIMIIPGNFPTIPGYSENLPDYSRIFPDFLTTYYARNYAGIIDACLIDISNCTSNSGSNSN